MNLRLEVQEVNLVLNSLAQLPYKVSAELIAKITQQVSNQNEEESQCQE